MGIANIINTAGGGGGSSEIITHLVNSVDGAGLRLANQGYISCADVSANRLGTNDFSVEFVLSQETSAINADIFISNFNSSNQAVDAAVIRWDVAQNDNIQLVFTNSSAAETPYNFGYDPAPDLNEPTHYLVSADRSGNAVLYRNGAEIASVSIAASSSANVGNSGQPTVIGSPVNNFGVKGNVYRFRTYSKALSPDEAKNVFDRADVPTALVSNLLLDLDCAYANPTQSTVIQDRGPNNQDGTLNGTITQTNVIKQLNSTSARIGTTAATPADGQLITSGNIGVGVVPEHGADISGNTRLYHNAGGSRYIFSSDNNNVKSGIKFNAASPSLELITDTSTHLSIDSSGNLFLGKTNSGTSKTNKVAFQQYDSGAESEGYAALFNYALSGNNNLLIGGGSASHNAATKLEFYTAANETTRTGTARLTIASDGLCTFSNGIAFSQTDSTAASDITTTLDHYERGVWTPVIADAATGGNTGSGSTVTGYYERIGNAVTVTGLATNVDTTGLTGTNVLFMRGLPFPAGYSSGTFSNLGRAVGSCVLDSVDVDTSTRSVSTMVTGQNSYFTFHQTRDAVGDSNILVSNLSSGTSDLFFSFTYFVD